MRKIDLNKSPESHCPRFDGCNINKCPLSRDYAKLKNDAIDYSKTTKEKCTNKVIRKEIGKAFSLPFCGMTSHEFNGEKRFKGKYGNENEIKS